MQMSEEKLNVTLEGESADKFRRIKAYLELKNDTEVIRTLIRLFYQQYEKELLGPPKTMWHMNLNEWGVLVWDPDLGEAPQIHFKPEGIICEHCEVDNCKHVTFALSKEDVQKVRGGEKRVWNFTPRTAQRLVKKVFGDVYYPHFFRLNAAVSFCRNPDTSIQNVKAWFGWKRIETINKYMGLARRDISEARTKRGMEFKKH